MIFTVYQGNPLALLLAFPDWSNAITVELELPTNIDPAISALESRRAFSGAARYSIAYTALLSSAEESTQFRLFLTRLKGELLAVPMWCDQAILTAPIAAGAVNVALDPDWVPVRYGAEWILVNDDGSQWEIVTVNSLVSGALTLAAGTQYAWPAGAYIYPLMFGRFGASGSSGKGSTNSDRPKPEWITDETTHTDIKIKEDSAYSHRLAPFGGAIPTVGATVPNFSALPLWTVYPKFDKPTDSTEADVLYSPIGFLRNDQQYVYGQGNRRTMEIPFEQASRADIAAIERLFVDRRGQTKSFLVPTFRGDVRLAADVAIGDGAISVEQTELTDPDRPTNAGDPYLALVSFDLADFSQPPAIEPVKWIRADITGQILSLDVPAAQAHRADSTVVSHLLLARFNDTKLSWSYKTDGLATAKVKFFELTNEYVTGAAPGVTPPVFCYRFTHQLPVPQYWYFTSFENTVPIGAGTYAGTYLPAPFSHGSLKTSAKLNQEKMELDSFMFPGNPLALFVPFQLQAPLWLDVLEFDGDDLTVAPTVAFTGEVWEVDPKGPEWKATCLVFGRHLEKPFPNFNVQQVCNYAVYTPLPRCGVNKATFATTSNVTYISSTEVHVAGGAAGAADKWSNGFVETGAGANFERRTISHSEPLAGGAGTKLLLNAPLIHAVNGQALTMYPGCNGTKDTCKNVFNNYANFGGFPYVPDANPSVKAMNVPNNTGGKK